MVLGQLIITGMKLYKLMLFPLLVFAAGAVASCGKVGNETREHDSHLYGEWVEDGDNSHVFDYYCFYSDGTGIHGSYEADIDWVNEDDDIEWYTVDDEYLYIDGARYEYSCDGTSLEIQMNGRTRYYYEK